MTEATRKFFVTRTMIGSYPPDYDTNIRFINRVSDFSRMEEFPPEGRFWTQKDQERLTARIKELEALDDDDPRS